VKRVRGVIAGDLALFDLPSLTRARLRFEFRLPNAQRMTLETLNMPGIAESIPDFLWYCDEHPDGSMRCPREARDVVEQALRYDGLYVEWEDRRVGPNAIPEIWTADVSLREYQREGVQALHQDPAHAGVIVLPCGTGKTRLAMGAIAAIRLRTLVMVPTIDLVNQWNETLDALQPHLTRGQFGDGVKPKENVDVVITTGASLRLFLETDAGQAWVQQFGLFICDEVHRAAASTLVQCISRIPARYRMGLTATPDRADGLTAVMHWIFGRTLMRRTTKEMIAAGHLMPAEIEFSPSAFRFTWEGESDDPRRIHALDRALIEDVPRIDFVVQRAAVEARAGECVLILANRKEMCTAYEEKLRAAGIEATMVTGSTGVRKRRTAMADFKEGRLPILIATSLADEGLDVPRLSRVILAYPQAGETPTIQRLGRLLRYFQGKKPKLIDITDPHVGTMKWRAASRKQVYQEAGLLE
jgi:superfamily II DNA or RNA helicase